MISLANNFNTVGRVPSGGHIDNKTSAYTSPTGFFPSPLETAAGPRQLFTIEQLTARADNAIGQMGTRTLENMPCWPGMVA